MEAVLPFPQPCQGCNRFAAASAALDKVEEKARVSSWKVKDGWTDLTLFAVLEALAVR